jgi:hypothetical protein
MAFSFHHLLHRHLMVALLVAATCAASMPGTAQAQAAETVQQRRAAAQALVKSMESLMGAERMMQGMRSAMQTPLQQQLKAASHLTFEQRDRALAVLSEAMTSTLGEWTQEMLPSMYAAMTDIYVERFTLAEIEDLRRFYSTTAGQKSMTVMQEDMPRMMEPMMQKLQARAMQIKQRMDAAIERLEREGIRLNPPRP